MKIFTKSLVTTAATTSLALAGLTGCGAFEKKKSSNKTAAPVELDTTVTSTEQQADGGTIVTLKYASTDTAAKFKCQVQLAGENASSNWEDCQETLRVPAGKTIKLTVKAVSANGTEDKSPAILVFTAGGSSQEGQQPSTGNLAVEIVEKAQIGQTVTSETLAVTFALRGATQVDAAKVAWLCKRENEAQAKQCSRDGAARYDFGKLVNGMSYSLSVQALVEGVNTPVGEDKISFTARLDGGLQVIGDSMLQSQKTGTVALRFVTQGNEAVYCAINDQQAVDCSQGYSIRLDRLPAGSHTLALQVRGEGNEVVGTRAISFCARQCSGDQGGAPAPIDVQGFLIGNFYEFAVPRGMHVQQYATNKNAFEQPSFKRINPASDPYYVGNYACGGEFDRMFTAYSTGGEAYDYCESTAPEVVYKWITEHRLANNHIQVATDVGLIESGRAPHEIISVSVYDQQYEFMQGRSRFERLCMNAIDGMGGLSRIRRSPPIAMVDSFWQREWKHAEFWVCDVMLSGAGGGFGGRPELWKVGAFVIMDRGLEFPDFLCNTCQFAAPNVLEVVYMSQKQQPDAFFARDAQNLFLSTLREARP